MSDSKRIEATAAEAFREAALEMIAGIDALVEHAGNATLRYPENEDAKDFAREAGNVRARAGDVMKRTPADASPMTRAEALGHLAEQADSAAYNAEQAWAAVGGE